MICTSLSIFRIQYVNTVNLSVKAEKLKDMVTGPTIQFRQCIFSFLGHR